jgi:quercetin dioxygenase-like cupin family protein
MKFRRVVTGHDADGKSVVMHDGPPPRSKALEHTPGFAMSIVWATRAGAPPDPTDWTTSLNSVVPGPGESAVHVVTFPPDAVMQSPTFDPMAAGREHATEAPGLVDYFEPDEPGMHTTPTVDYGIVLDGEIWLELDDGKLVHLRQHDIIVQNATRHAWRNKSTRTATVAFILMGQAGATRS